MDCLLLPQKEDEKRIYIAPCAEEKRIVIVKIQDNSFTNSFTSFEKA